MAELNKSNNKQVSDSFIYVEPNETFGSNGEQLPLEKLSVYFELRVDYSEAQIIKHNVEFVNETNNIIFVAKIHNNGIDTSIYDGVRYDSKKKDTFLTTEGYGNYTINSINRKGTNELFGVESVDISYDSFMVPEVNIRFTDVKGAALHGAAELAHDDSGKLQEKADVSMKFLSSFFSVPYPKFDMFVKGFYGKPVHYDLTCADVRSEFDANSGNYNVNVKMVGYSYGLISDITIASLIAAPYSSYEGKQYWAENCKTRFSLDGNVMPTLQEFINVWYNKLSELQTKIQENPSQINDVKRNFNNYEDVLSLIQQYCVKIKVWYDKQQYANSQLFFDSEKYMLINLTSNNKEQINTARSLFQNEWREITQKTQLINWNDINIFNENILFDEINSEINKKNKRVKNINSVLNKLKVGFNTKHNINIFLDNFDWEKNDIRGFHYLSFEKIINKISALASQEYKQISNDNSQFEQKISDEIKKIFNFNLTVKNFTKILFAHLETLLYMYNCVAEATSQRKIKPFPSVSLEIINNDNKKNTEEIWLGEYDNTMHEVKMVEGIISGVQNKDFSENQAIVSIANYNDFSNIAVHDLFKNENFFTGVLTNELLRKRIIQIFGLNGLRGDIDAYAVGEIDANNYLKVHPRGYNEIANDLLLNRWKFENVIRINDNDEKDIKYSFENGEEINIASENFSQYSKDFVNYNFDTSCDNFKIIENIEYYDNESIYSYNNNYNEISFDISNGWGSKAFDYDKFINRVSALIVPKALDANDVATMPYQKMRTFIKENENKYDGGQDSVSNSYSKVIDKNRSNIEYDASTIDAYDLNRDIIFNYEFKDEKQLITHRIQRQVDDDLKIQYIIGDGNNKYDHVYRVLRCDKKMNSNGYTIISIPGYGYYGTNVDYDYTLFTSPAYTEQNDIYLKAILFLGTFQWGKGKIETDLTAYWDFEKHINDILLYNHEGEVNVYNLFEVVPYFYVLTLGAIIYLHEVAKKNYASGNMLRSSHYAAMGAGYHPFSKKYPEGLKCLQNSYKQKLLQYFMEWVDNTYCKWDDVFMNEQDSSLYYVTLSSPSLHHDTVKEYLHCFRETHWLPQELTRQFFKLVVLFKATPFLIPYKDDNIPNLVNFNKENILQVNYYVQKQKIVDYLNGFSHQLEKNFQDKISTLTEDTVGGVFCNNTIKHNVYLYLKSIWERWVSHNNFRFDDWYINNIFEGENQRLHFIDSSYNDISNILTFDVEKSVELLQSSKTNEGMTLLTFLSYFYRDNNCYLYNIQNFLNFQEKDSIKNIFEPQVNINWDKVKHMSDLVVMYSYQPSKTIIDSVNIDDEENNLPSQIKNKLNDNSLRIPAFGVTYGMQNQNYFIDVGVSMTTPTVTDQSLQALFRIADENSKEGGTDSGKNIINISGNMYQVYSNQAYQCNVTMMGCAWIQPLMYFQLFNIPLFRGAYIIHKVTHSITPNNMITKFVGTKISRDAMKMAESNFYYFAKDIIRSNGSVVEAQIANISNTCNYAFYSPYVENNDDFTKKLDLILSYFNSFIDDSNKVIDKLAATIYLMCKNETSSLLEENELMHLAIIYCYNIWVREKNEKLLDYLLTQSTAFQYYYNKINDMSIQNSADIRNYIIDCFKDVLSFANKIKTISQWYYLPQISICLLNENLSGFKTWIYGGIIFIVNTKNDKSYWLTYVSNKTNEKNYITVDNLLISINKTIKDVYNDAFLEKQREYEKRAILVTQIKDEYKKATIFDIILQTYSQYLSVLIWGVSDKSSGGDLWDYIIIEVNNTNKFIVSTAYMTNSNLIIYETIKGHITLNVNFYTSIMKKYFNTQTKIVDGKILTEWTNYVDSEPNVKQKLQNIKNFFENNELTKNIKIMNCEDRINDIVDEKFLSMVEQKNGYQWIGAIDANGNPQKPGTLANENQMYKLINTVRGGVNNIMEQAAIYAVEHIKKTHQTELLKEYECAKYIRQALESVGVDTAGRPNSACRYWKFLEYWGFTRVFSGLSFGSEIDTFDFKNGDIIVIAGKEGKSNRHGHIQIYYNNKWYSDREYSTAGAYKDKQPRPCCVYRLIIS